MNTKHAWPLLLGLTLTSAASAQIGAGMPGGAATGMTNAPIAGPAVVNPQNPNGGPNPGQNPSPGPMAPNSAPPPNDVTTMNNTSAGFRGAPLNAPGAPAPRTVTSAQQALSSQGFNVSVDGIMGINTQNAIRQFQASNGLNQSGVLDTETLKALGVGTTPGQNANP